MYVGVAAAESARLCHKHLILKYIRPLIKPIEEEVDGGVAEGLVVEESVLVVVARQCFHRFEGRRSQVFEMHELEVAVAANDDARTHLVAHFQLRIVAKFGQPFALVGLIHAV